MASRKELKAEIMNDASDLRLQLRRDRLVCDEIYDKAIRCGLYDVAKEAKKAQSFVKSSLTVLDAITASSVLPDPEGIAK